MATLPGDLQKALSLSGSNFEIPGQEETSLNVQPSDYNSGNDVSENVPVGPIPRYITDSSSEEEILSNMEENRNRSIEIEKNKKKFNQSLTDDQPGGMVNYEDVYLNQYNAVPAQQTGSSSEDMYERLAPSIAKALDKQKTGLAMTAQAGKVKAAYDAGFLKEYENRIKDLDAEEVKDREEFRFIMKGRIKDYETQLNELKKMDSLSKTEAMQKWFSDRSTPVKIAAGIGFAISILASPTKAGGAAYSIFDDLFESEINAQERSIAKSKSVASGYKNLMDGNLRIFGSLEQSRIATRAQLDGLLEAKLKRSAAMTENQRLKGSLLTLAGEAENKAIGSMQKLMSLSMSKWQLEKQQRMENRFNQYSQDQLASPGFDIRNIPFEKRNQFIEGRGMATSSGGAERFKKLQSQLLPAMDSIDELLKISDRWFQWADPFAKRDARVIQETLVGNLREAVMGPGILTPAERAIIKSLVENPTDIFSIDKLTRRSLNKLKDVLTRGMERSAQAEGLQYDRSVSILKNAKKAQ